MSVATHGKCTSLGGNTPAIRIIIMIMNKHQQGCLSVHEEHRPRPRERICSSPAPSTHVFPIALLVPSNLPPGPCSKSKKLNKQVLPMKFLGGR
jgi:hypothetical protein